MWPLSRFVIGFQSYQFRQINPDVNVNSSSSLISLPSFNRINSGRSIPTSWDAEKQTTCWVLRFNRINSGRSIPTRYKWEFADTIDLFQSYQFRQINPDAVLQKNANKKLKGFNRINSGRSIPTYSWLAADGSEIYMFQSYQFRQINPDFVKTTCSLEQQKRFNRINSGRSIPT